ncbi:TIM barrel protein [Luteococcus sp. OSA5]|uniref:TIM barrel protein n=1 Tax=Luteococcus sp. OSA5 TaxID=3401630 RepID=UPI003B42E20D
MTDHHKDTVVNLSTVYRGLPRDERPAAAVADGHRRAESWWDFDSATPARNELDGFLQAVSQSGLRLVAINSHGGDRDAGERGLACLPDRQEEFRDSIESVCRVAGATDARKFNVTFGQLDPSRWSEEEQLAVAEENYRWAASRVAEFGGTILIEALSREGNGGYPFHDGHDVQGFIRSRLADVDNVGLLFDTFHLAGNGVDILQAFRALVPVIRHVQLADWPGRGAPGTGGIDFTALETIIRSSGYQGDVALEYLG